ncbi:glycosyltransferase 87 family protein [Acidisphaera rubrifaciens]|uniref:Mannosyltransferase n=1 Tax=Acidisphaera rubrifaciens HS-AP3 TaxID=1231350 RepID=A0A0D6P5Z2_9PROT|nr:glycosyltransferase 87 family protein [Acidisphaera rubrifaciens]GAN76299.1 hypothetical protein Asru_0084_10 [Acidisphaera rubrifaciens HS-AP3]
MGLLVASGGVYFAAVHVILRHAWPRAATLVVLTVAVLLRMLLLTQPPVLSSDIYRYVWDGRVQAAGINPYRYVPADPALATLRDAVVYSHINRATYARTIYPPFAQLVFATVGRVWGTVTGMRLAMLGFEALAIVCLLRLLPLAGLPRERIAIYAWNPLALWSFVSDGHVDAIAIGLLGFALLLRARHRDGWAGAALAGAVLVKFIPLVVAPAFLRGGRFWRPVLVGLAIVVGAYAIYLDAGRHVIGFLPSYGQEEGITTGHGIWLLAGLARLGRLSPLAPAIYAAGAALLFVGLVIAVLCRRPPENDVRALCRDTAMLGTIATVAISPHYHWYFAWLALPAVIAPSRAVLWLATAPLLLISEPVVGDRFLWPSLIYVPAAVLLLADVRWQRAIHLRQIASIGE